MSTAAKNLLADIEAAISGKRALKTFFKEMGYILSPRYVKVALERADGQGKDYFIVHELLDEDDKNREVPFAFLYDRRQENGVVLPHPFSRYKGLVAKTKVKADS